MVWFAVGGLVGWLASTLAKPDTYLVFVENMAVAVFGSFLGGEFVAAQFRSGPKVAGFTVMALGLATFCSVVMVMLLRFMRRSVGPLRSGKAKPRR